MTAATTGAPSRADAPPAVRALGNVLVIAGAFCAAVALVLLAGLGGWEYYSTPLGTRGYLPAHRLLRPSGTIGLLLGVAGVVSMLATLPYALRKRWRPTARLGALPRWLEVHIFFGIVGPVLVTFHTSFKFNGLISVGYWLMMAVWASGFVGRYLYVRIPKTIRGTELSREQVEVGLAATQRELDRTSLPTVVRAELDAFQAAAAPVDGRAPHALDLFLGELRVRARLAVLRRRLRGAGVDVELLHAVVALAAEHATLLRRLAHLQRTRHLFELWHVFHRPLVYAMFAIVAVHVGVALYLGYARLP